MQYNNKLLSEKQKSGEPLEFIFFWGHQPGKAGQITSSCFSQWYGIGFEYKGIEYATAEHWMMAEKARLFHDSESLILILNSNTPEEAKALGRRVENFDDTVWKAKRESIVMNGNYLKFTQNASLRNYLLSTEEKVIVEASPYDRIWGVGLKSNNPRINKIEDWQGLNLLGYALMEVRDKIRKEKT